MPDIRELLILNPRAVALGSNRLPKRMMNRLRMALRRFVLSTGRLSVFRHLYLAAYRFHVWVAKKVLTRFEGTKAIYLSAGMGRGEIRPGISDIDLVVFGDWDEKTQFRVLKSLAVVVLTMPLFDRESLGAIQTWNDFLHMNRTDLLLAYHYASAKKQWKLVWGEDLIQNLPDLSDKRRAGAAYLDVRRWWGVFIRMAVGQNVTAQDPIFRNTLSFKSVADVLRAELFAKGIAPPSRRVETLRSEMPAADIELRDRLLRSEASQFLSMEGDPRELVTPWLLLRIEDLHTKLLVTASFESILTPRIEGAADERLITPEVMAHAERMAGGAELLPGFIAAYLLPCAGFLSPDSLALCIEFHAAQMPTVAQLRDWVAPHFDVLMDLPQRLSVYLLLEHGAYLLDCVFGLEIWSNVIMPHANPDFFELLARPDFLLRGTSRLQSPSIGWSRVSQELLQEELDVRRAAQARFGILSRPSSVENLRNLWRFLQLLVMERRRDSGEITIPVTLAAIRREFSALAPELSDDLLHLESAMQDVVHGKAVATDDVMQRVYDWTSAHGLGAKAVEAGGGSKKT